MTYERVHVPFSEIQKIVSRHFDVFFSDLLRSRERGSVAEATADDSSRHPRATHLLSLVEASRATHTSIAFPRECSSFARDSSQEQEMSATGEYSADAINAGLVPRLCTHAASTIVDPSSLRSKCQEHIEAPCLAAQNLGESK